MERITKRSRTIQTVKMTVRELVEMIMPGYEFETIVVKNTNPPDESPQEMVRHVLITNLDGEVCVKGSREISDKEE